MQFGNVLVASSQMQNRAMLTVSSPPHAEGSADVSGWAIRASHARIHVSAVGLRANAGSAYRCRNDNADADADARS